MSPLYNTPIAYLDDLLTSFRQQLPGYGELVLSDDPFPFTPTNFWAEDRSWFVLTDYDSWGTKVHGSVSLIEEVLREPDLETIALPL